MTRHAAKKIHATSLLKEAAQAINLCEELLNETPHREELALLRQSRNMQLAGMMVAKLSGEAGGRSAQEHRAADLAEEHGLPEADHRASRRTGRSHTVVRVPSWSPIPVRRLHLVGFDRGTVRAVRRGRGSVTGGARKAADSATGRTQTGLCEPQRREGIWAHAPPQGPCENLICVLSN